MKSELRTSFLPNAVILFFALSLLAGTGCGRNEPEDIHVAVAGPSELDAAVRLCFDGVNEQGGVGGRRIVADFFEDRNDPEIAWKNAGRMAKENRAVAVIGHANSAACIRAGAAYKKHGIPAITPVATNSGITLGNEWYFRTMYNDARQGRFLAIYAKEVLKQDTASIISFGKLYGSYLSQVFEKEAGEIGLEMKYKWSFEHKEPEKRDKALERIVGELASKKDAGIIFLAVYAEEGIPLVKRIRDRHIPNPMIASDALDTEVFLRGFATYPEEIRDPGHYTRNLYVVSPLIFDTADTKIQDFRRTYKEKRGKDAHWEDIFAYETASLLAEALEKTGITGKPRTVGEERKKIRDWLANLDSENPARGITGPIRFDENGDLVGKSLYMGAYREGHFVSAMEQLRPVPYPALVPDIREETEKGNILFTGDAHLYRTKVVYVGMDIAKISEIDVTKSSCLIGFHIWFRYQGDKFDVQNVEFINAMDSVRLPPPPEISENGNVVPVPSGSKEMKEILGTPGMSEMRGNKSEKHETVTFVREEEANGVISVLYRVRARFSNDFKDSGTMRYHAGFRFRHRELTRDNLIYVADVFGMELGDERAFSKKMEKARVLASEDGWNIDHAFFSQDTIEKSTMGSLAYLGFPKKSADYSRFGVNVTLRKDSLPARISGTSALWLAILACTAIFLLSIAGDRLMRWPPKLVWLMELLFAILLLFCAEALLVKGPLEDMSMKHAAFVLQVFGAFYWLVPAVFLHLALEPFIWEPVRRQSGRPVPKVLRRLPAYLIYFVAGYGVIVFVFDLNVNRIMATSGALAMGIGLLVKDNIANYFASIAILQGYEIRIGHWVKIGDFEEGQVQEVTRMATRLVRRDGSLLNIPNSVVLGSTIENYSHPNDACRLSFGLETVPEHSPARVRKVLEAATLSTDGVLSDPPPKIVFDGQGDSSARYTVTFFVRDYGKKPCHLTAVWESVWVRLEQEGIELATPHRIMHLLDETPGKADA